MDQGLATRASVAQLIESSPEYRSDQVQDLYSRYLHRPADAGGLAGFVQFLGQGGTLEQAAALITSSLEYYQTRGKGTDAGFLAALYEDGLQRRIDAYGQTAWELALAGGASREQVATAIFASDEYRRGLVESYYQTLLQRPADSNGLNSFVSALRQGVRDEALIAEFAGSDEYFSRL